MEIWADNVKVGDEIWYKSSKSSSGFQFSKVTKKDFKRFLIPTLIMENGDRLFVNQFVYDSKEDISKEKIETLITYKESVMNEHEDYAQYAQYLSTPAISVSTERLLQCTKDIINYCILKPGRFVDKLPEIKYMSDEELMKYLIKTSNKS